MKRSAILATAATLLLTAGVWLGTALATGVPTESPLTWAGVITDKSGKPYPNTVDVSVAFYSQASGGTAVCQSGAVKAEAGSGRFSVTLPKDCATAVHGNANLWSEVTAGPNKEALPRMKVGAVPYALEAQNAVAASVASSAAGALKADIDKLKLDVGGAGGGGPTAVDGTGTTMGALLSASYSFMSFVTAKGYAINANWDGTFLSSAIYFAGKDCKGTPYYKSGYVMTTKYAAHNPAGGSWYTPVDAGGGAGSVVTVKPLSLQVTDGTCLGGPPETKYVPLKKVPPANIGVNPNWKPPFTFKP